MSAQLIPLGELEEHDVAAWRELASRTVEPNPFFDPDFVLPAARALGAWDDVAVATTRQGSDWTGCLPVRRERRWHRLPLPCIATWRHSYCLLGTPLLAPERSGEELGAILGSMRTAGKISFAALEWIPAEGPIAAELEQVGGATIPFDRFARATLVRRPQCDYLDGRVKGKHRREFRRMAAALADELGGELELVDRSDDGGAIETFLTLEASGWKGREETALAANAAHATFFGEIARALAARGDFELLFLEVDGRAVAARCSLLAGGASFCFKVAYDEQFRRYSPGRELELLLIEKFHEDGELTWMDSCADVGNKLFNRLWPDRRELATVAFPAPGPLGLPARPGIRGVVAARDRRRRRSDG